MSYHSGLDLSLAPSPETVSARVCVPMNECVHVSECICLCVFVGVLLMTVLSHADTEQSRRGLGRGTQSLGQTGDFTVPC